MIAFKIRYWIRIITYSIQPTLFFFASVKKKWKKKKMAAKEIMHCFETSLVPELSATTRTIYPFYPFPFKPSSSAWTFSDERQEYFHPFCARIFICKLHICIYILVQCAHGNITSLINCNLPWISQGKSTNKWSLNLPLLRALIHRNVIITKIERLT